MANILSGSENPGPHTVIHLRSGARLTLPDVTAIRQKFDHHRARALTTLVDECLLALAAVAVVAGAFGWVMAGRALSPVRRITQTARRAADGNLRERIGLAGPLTRSRSSPTPSMSCSSASTRPSRASASSRRTLRMSSAPPLATNRTVLEVAVASGRIPADLRELVDTVLATNARSELIIDGLLTLARSESQAITRVPVDLSDVAADAVEQTAGEAAAARVTVDATPDPAGTVGDPVLLEHLALNLVRNGLRHNHPGGWVTVSTTRPRAVRRGRTASWPTAGPSCRPGRSVRCSSRSGGSATAGTPAARASAWACPSSGRSSGPTADGCWPNPVKAVA